MEETVLDGMAKKIMEQTTASSTSTPPFGWMTDEDFAADWNALADGKQGTSVHSPSDRPIFVRKEDGLLWDLRPSGNYVILCPTLWSNIQRLSAECNVSASPRFMSRQSQEDILGLSVKSNKENKTWTPPTSKLVSECASCKKTREKRFSHCSQCKMTFYCSVSCQRQDWPQHKLHCKELVEMRNRLYGLS
jgi:hypothetical protein